MAEPTKVERVIGVNRERHRPRYFHDAIPKLLKAAADEAVARFTGKPKPNQKPLLDLGAPTWWALSTSALLGATAVNAILLTESCNWGVWALAIIPVSAMLTVITTGRLRVQQVSFGHHAVHGSVFKSSKLNRIAAHVTTTLSFSQNPDDYREDHVIGHHQRGTFTTEKDPDAALLLALGFRRGMTRRQAKRHLVKTLLSPKSHYMIGSARIRSALNTANWPHRALVLGWLATLAAVATAIPWWAFLIAVALPLGPLYHMSALLQFLTEHRWLITKDGPGKDRDAYVNRCAGRFSGETRPSSEMEGLPLIVAWIGWSIRALLIHAPWRLGVIVGDLPAHDWHHVVGLLKHHAHDWDEAIFERQRAVDEGDVLRLAERELWGPGEAINWVFEGLETAEI
ncbi:fatty acid desaturase [Bradyrhizobium nanningense]|uniref:fatty acid desaturase n=1 Tax=Bradyrhizobium nanningense TaxID=1325118 RepID=UPI001008C7CA|nr:fatty acid desaturase [Bradyrhizobium nanningense]